MELIKNAYDADATHVVIDGRYLDDPKRGVITINDDGIGMSPDQFREGFLRSRRDLRIRKSQVSAVPKEIYGGKGHRPVRCS